MKYTLMLLVVLATFMNSPEAKSDWNGLRQSKPEKTEKVSEVKARDSVNFELSESEKRKLDLEVYERFLEGDNALSFPTPECQDGCDDNDVCTEDTCDPTNGCVHTPLGCSENESCDPIDGQCKISDDLRPCIAVIDETEVQFSDAQFVDAKWASFRAEWPDRFFCLLQPQIPLTDPYELYIPPAFLSDPRTKNVTVNRDRGIEADASDWFNECGLGSLSTSGIDFVGLFIDESGSMDLSTVQASYDLFLTTLTNTGLSYCTVTNPNEDWITPFQTTLGTVGGGGTCVSN